MGWSVSGGDTMLTAKVFELTGPRQLVLNPSPLEDETLQDGDLLAQTIVSAISPGTETAAYIGAPPLRPGKVYPRVVGYCNVARILKSRSTRYASGDLILTNQSHRSHFIIGDQKVLGAVSPAVSPEKAAMTYLYQLGYNALWKGGFFPGYSVAAVGLGVIGLAAIVHLDALMLALARLHHCAAGYVPRSDCGRTDKREAVAGAVDGS